MVLAVRRAYVAAVRARRAARPPDFSRSRFARRATSRSFVAGCGLLALIGIFAPGRFGQPGADTLRSGWPLWVLGAVVVSVVVAAFWRRRELMWALQRLREPFMRPLTEEPTFDEAADALAACPGPLRVRYAVSYSWGPAAAAVLGATFAVSCAYFVVDAVLARLRVGWAHPVYAAGFAALSLVVFAVAAGRLTTWRLATSVRKEVTTGYPEAEEA